MVKVVPAPYRHPSRHDQGYPRTRVAYGLCERAIDRSGFSACKTSLAYARGPVIDLGFLRVKLVWPVREGH